MRTGIIGGSGLYKIEGLKIIKEIEVATPFGEPSDKYVLSELGGKEVVFLPRHGRGHRIPPARINYRANIYGMKKLGVERIISVSACGSLKDELKPQHFVIPLQFVDRTHQRVPTFFDQGMTVHVMFADPVCEELARTVYHSAKELSLQVHLGGTYLNMEGPAFSTKAESHLYRSWGMDIIGMTNMSEARLAREAEICYVTLAAVTDYDCWHPGHDSVTVDMILDNLRKNVENAKNVIAHIIPNLPEARQCPCKDALKTAIVTSAKLIPPKIKEKLNILISKYI